MNLASLFTRSASSDPSKLALFADEKYHTYATLLSEVRAIQNWLSDCRLARGSRVAVVGTRTISCYAGMLATMASGHVYVPINPKFPASRIAAILNDAEVAAMISAAKPAESLLTVRDGMPVLEWKPLDRVGAVDVEVAPICETDLAYLIYTSGTTGVPKGVPVTHASAWACISAIQDLLKTRSDDRFTQFSELSFDVSIGEILLCWLSGACLFAPSEIDLFLPLEFVRRHSLTVWSSVPLLALNVKSLGLLEPRSAQSLRIAFFCGEALPSTLVSTFVEAAPHCAVFNLYGPTEAAIFSTAFRVPADAESLPAITPIGMPLRQIVARTEFSVDGRSPGELLLAGPQVSRGYWKRPLETTTAFIENQGMTWYKTGDIVSHDARWGLLFHGRVDHQVKVRGYRVEILEVEAVVRRVTNEDLVAVVPVGEHGLCEELVAYCRRLSLDSRTIAGECAKYLPAYMIPSHFVSLDVFPTIPSGKIDYKMLKQMARELRYCPRHEAG